MPIHVPSWLRKSLNPNQIIDAFDRYGEKVIDWVSREGSIAERALITSGVVAARPLAAIADQLMDAGMPFINLYYGEKYNPFTLKRYRSADPFKQKGGVVRPSNSQLPAHRMPKRGRDIGEDFLLDPKRSRGMPRQPSQAYGLATRVKKFRKTRKLKPDKSGYVTRNYDDFGTMQRNHAWYMGFQHHGSRGRLWNIVGEAVVKAALRKLGIYPRSYEEIINSPEFDTMVLSFKRINAAGVDETSNPPGITINSRRFKVICDDVATAIADRADGNPGAAPTADTVAYYLDVIRLQNVDGSKAHKEMLDVGEALIDIKVSQTIRFQNVTKNTSGDLSLDKAGLNPLTGKKYVFANYRPKLIGKIHDWDSQLDSFNYADPSLQGGPFNEIAEGVMKMPVGGSVGREDLFAHPPKASEVFTNCKGTANIFIAAGGMKYEKTYFTMTHKMRSLVERVYFAGYDKGAYGGMTWFGFEKAYKQAQPAGIVDDDMIVIGFNRKVSMHAKCTFKTQKSMMRHYEIADVGLIQ